MKTAMNTTNIPHAAHTSFISVMSHFHSISPAGAGEPPDCRQMPDKTPSPEENEYIQFLSPMSSSAFSCNECFQPVKRGDLAIDCADCGAIICEKCVRTGRVYEHVCEEDGDFEF